MTFLSFKGAKPCRRPTPGTPRHQNQVSNTITPGYAESGVPWLEWPSTSHARCLTAPKQNVKHSYTWLCRVQCPLARQTLDAPRSVPRGTKTNCQTLLHTAMSSLVSPGSKGPRRPTPGAPRRRNQMSNALTHGCAESGVCEKKAHPRARASNPLSPPISMLEWDENDASKPL